MINKNKIQFINLHSIFAEEKKFLTWYKAPRLHTSYLFNPELRSYKYQPRKPD